jgi:hypothetical protein
MEALQCSKCATLDHHGYNKYFCRCEDRNIKLAKELRERGINAWDENKKNKEGENENGKT